MKQTKSNKMSAVMVDVSKNLVFIMIVIFRLILFNYFTKLDIKVVFLQVINVK